MRCLLVLVPLTLLAPVQESAAQGTPTRELISFLWASGIEGKSGINDRITDIDSSFSDLIEFVDVGGSIRYRSSTERLGWYLEGTYVQLSDSIEPVPSVTKLEFTRRIGEIGFSLAFAPSLSGYAGLRGQKLDSELRTVDGQIFGSDTSWVDGIVGLRWTPIDSPTWVGWVRGDIGAGGADSVWLGEVGGGYRFGGRWATYLAYRILSTDYEGDGIVYDTDEAGLAFGFGISF